MKCILVEVCIFWYRKDLQIIQNVQNEQYEIVEFDVHVTVHRNKFLIINTIRCTNFSNLFLE